ncbi:MAG: transcription antitermination protein NusB [Candidatus Sumerlaeota bacterium]|nr:transcription antitermination protein NusB [Candidatus Sumerlaeota bacterium]
MSRRRRSREAALQVLYAMGFTAQDRQEAIAHVGMIESDDVRPQDELSTRLLGLVEQHHDAIDDAMAAALKNWTEDRLTASIRAVLRLGTAELLFCADIPARVSINEYIELAREFGDDDSPGFVNGVLDRVRKIAGREIDSAPAKGHRNGRA